MSASGEKTKEHVLYLVNMSGHCFGVQLSMELWEKLEPHVKEALQQIIPTNDPFDQPEPLDALADLKAYWDFTYPYTPEVYCDACGAATEDWENDSTHPFHLNNANIGGLLVFRCRCGATVRKKHFHKKVVFECSPVSS